MSQIQNHPGYILPRSIQPRLHDPTSIRLLHEGPHQHTAMHGLTSHCITVFYFVSFFIILLPDFVLY